MLRAWMRNCWSHLISFLGANRNNFVFNGLILTSLVFGHRQSLYMIFIDLFSLQVVSSVELSKKSFNFNQNHKKNWIELMIWSHFIPTCFFTYLLVKIMRWKSLQNFTKELMDLDALVGGRVSVPKEQVREILKPKGNRKHCLMIYSHKSLGMDHLGLIWFHSRFLSFEIDDLDILMLPRCFCASCKIWQKNNKTIWQKWQKNCGFSNC